MGKQAKRKKERAPGGDFVARFLRRCGLPAQPDGRAFRQRTDADPEWSRRLSEAEEAHAALAADQRSDPAEVAAAARAQYALVYRDLDTALAEYAARAVSIAGSWLRWWSDHHPPAGRLLDAGCGAGVLTCAYALALPEAEVVGIDVVPEAVACAEALAGRLGAANVSFSVADYADPAGGPGGAFDQVLAVTALGDGGVYPGHRAATEHLFSSVTEVDGPAQHHTSPPVGAVAGRLAPGGWLLAFDRTPYAAQAVWLGAALLHAGIDLDLRRAGTEQITEEGEKHTFTRLVGVRADPVATSPADLAAWVKVAEPPAFGRVWHDELRYERLKAGGATLRWAAEIDYAPHSPVVERREVWEHASGAYGWVTTSLGLRQLTRGPGLDALVAENTAYAGRWARAGLAVRRYGR